MPLISFCIIPPVVFRLYTKRTVVCNGSIDILWISCCWTNHVELLLKKTLSSRLVVFVLYFIRHRCWYISVQCCISYRNQSFDLHMQIKWLVSIWNATRLKWIKNVVTYWRKVINIQWKLWIAGTGSQKIRPLLRGFRYWEVV